MEAGLPTRCTQPRRAGVLERAHGGTLVLDEVSDMPLETQGKIVRALQDQTFERIGGSAAGKGGRAGVVDQQQATCRRRSLPVNSAKTCSTGWRWCR